MGTDQSEAALAIAAENARTLDMHARARFVRADWRTENWASALEGQYDLILCNPPYVETDADLKPNVRDYEPHDALFAGADGLDDYKILIPALAELRMPDAPVIFEIGAAQDEAVADIAREHGYRTELRRDLAGHPRALILQ